MANGDTCVINIGPAQRRRRRIVSIGSCLVATAAAIALVAGGAARPWRLLLFLPLWIAALALFEVTAGTCVMLAARGVRDMDTGEERIENPAELTQLKQQSRQVHLKALLLSAALTAALLAI